MIGATTKRGKMDDKSQGGWFGSGAKFAAVAAVKLGLDAHVASSDSEGKYLVSYARQKSLIGGQPFEQIVMKFAGGPTVETSFTIDACLNWTKPLGDDGNPAYHVLREFLRNAYDADPDVKLKFVDTPEPAPKGETYVFLRATSAIRAMLMHTDRYFKYLRVREFPALATVPGVGEIWPKSEKGKTRVFSLGSLALCARGFGQSSVFDYSLLDKELMSEDRSFKSIYAVQRQTALLLASLKNPMIAHGILYALSEGRAELEDDAFGQFYQSDDIPGAVAWKEGWTLCYGEDAVLPSTAVADHLAQYSHKKKVIQFHHFWFKSFLKRCGVPDSISVLPNSTDDYQIVEPTDEERKRVDAVLPALLHDLPGLGSARLAVFVPLTEAKAQHIGFVFLGKNRPPLIHLQRGKAFASNHQLMLAIAHEYRHLRSQALDATLEFQAAADQELTDLRMIHHRIPDDRTVIIDPGLDAEIEKFFAELGKK
jgi:hypothetical protein